MYINQGRRQVLEFLFFGGGGALVGGESERGIPFC